MSHKEYLHVDSRKRISEDRVKTCSPVPLDIDPLEFRDGEHRILVKTDQKFHVGQSILIKNVKPNDAVMSNVVSFKKHSEFASISHPGHGLTLKGSYHPENDKHFRLVEYTGILPHRYRADEDLPDSGAGHYILDINHELQVKISGVRQDDAISATNISANYFNDVHVVYLVFQKTGNIYLSDPNRYLIKLNKKADANYAETGNIHNIYLNYSSLYGIPLRIFNSHCPALIVKSTTNDGFYVETEFPVAIAGAEYAVGGGPYVHVTVIKYVSPGYPNNNFYRYRVPNMNNVVSARLISSSFPNYVRTIDDDYNKIYWRIMENGDNIFCAKLGPGNITAQKIMQAMNREDVNKFQVEYDPDSGLMEFSCYRPVSLVSQSSTPLYIISSQHVDFESDDPIQNDFVIGFDSHNAPSHPVLWGQVYQYTHSNVSHKRLVLNPDLGIYLDLKGQKVANFNIAPCHQIEYNVTGDAIYGHANKLLKMGDYVITDRVTGYPQIYQIIAKNGAESRIQPVPELGINIGKISIRFPTIQNLRVSPRASNYVYLAYHNHGLQVGDNLSIPSLCDTCRVYRIVDKDNIILILDSKNVISPIIGSHLDIQIAVMFTFAHGQPESLLPRLGFFDDGVKFANIIDNSEGLDRRKMPVDYFYLCCPQLVSRVETYNKVEDVFAIINHDGYLNISCDLLNPVSLRGEIEFSLRDSDGRLMPTNIDHSFVIEFTLQPR